MMLGLVLTASVLAVGVGCVDRLHRVRREQLAVEDFNRFVERVQWLSAGGEGGTGFLELSLDGRIVVDGTLAKLVVGEETLRVEVLPLPVRYLEPEVVKENLNKVSGFQTVPGLVSGARNLIPSYLDENFSLTAGSYLFELKRGEGGQLFVGIRGG
jgi:hypothetical protein